MRAASGTPGIAASAPMRFIGFQLIGNRSLARSRRRAARPRRCSRAGARSPARARRRSPGAKARVPDNDRLSAPVTQRELPGATEHQHVGVGVRHRGGEAGRGGRASSAPSRGVDVTEHFVPVVGDDDDLLGAEPADAFFPGDRLEHQDHAGREHEAGVELGAEVGADDTASRRSRCRCRARGRSARATGDGRTPHRPRR